MSEKDKELITMAENCHDWNDIKALEDQAESQQAKTILHNRKTTLYHYEEGSAGLI